MKAIRSFVSVFLSGMILLSCHGRVAAAESPPGKAKGKRKAVAEVVAEVVAGGGSWTVRANSLGYFPPVFTPTNAVVHVEVRLPVARGGQPVLVRALKDGGVAPSRPRGGKAAPVEAAAPQFETRLDGQGRVRFSYQYGRVPHYQHVRIETGGERYVLHFHAHPPH